MNDKVDNAEARLGMFYPGYMLSGRDVELVQTFIASHAEQKELTRRSCEDWADAHTHLQKLCKDAGFTEYQVEGDSYGVPGIETLADLLAGKCAEQKKVLEWLEKNGNHVCIAHGNGLCYVTILSDGVIIGQGPTLTDAVLEAIKKESHE